MSSVVQLRRSRSLVHAATIGLALMAGLTSDQAHAWPDRTVKLVTPGSAGSHTDAIARLLADGLAKKWGHAVVVENQPGVDGIPAVRNFLASRDDHALLYTFNSVVTVNPALHEKLPYTPRDDLVPISHVVEDFIVIVATPALNIGTLGDLEALMRADPGRLNYASFPGAGYLAFQAFQERAGVNLAFVPYRAFTGALLDLIENRIQVGVLSLAMTSELAREGKLKILALASPSRAPGALDIPTAAELGFPELIVFAGHGLFARPGISPEVRERVLRDMREVLKEPATAQRVVNLGFVLRATGSDEFAAFLDGETSRVAGLVRRLGPRARARTTQ
jgi:tripartite-type tricarboxylate transporter receptor subunit TctC